MSGLSRRELLAAGSAGLLLPSLSLATPNPDRKRVLRVAHLTDPHVQPERGAPEGLEACLRHVEGQSEKVDLILMGGDLIMDALGATKERVEDQWDLYMAAMKTTKIPVRHSLGNHDVWGWGARATYEKEPKFGKVWACEVLELPKPYYSFDQSGWHFVVLDSTFPLEGNGYKARLDDEQFEWLKGDLAKVDAKTPVLVLSHIPILGICAMFDGDNEKSGDWVMPASYVHIDSRRIVDLFLKHRNVKLCLSGHEHQIDLIEYNGVTYCCNGAVCAGWWGGDYFQCTNGYGVVDLFDDGTFENRYVAFDWKIKG